MTKTRVYEVARELGLENRELLTKLASLGIQVRNHMSSIDPAEAERVKRAIDKDKQQNVVEERIRPTVVRRRVRKKPGAEVPAAEAALEAAQAAPAPGPKPEPVVEAKPEPKPAPKPARRPAAEAKPEPAPEPVSETRPVAETPPPPREEEAPKPAPEPVAAEPAPEPAPEPKPEPEPEPASQPAAAAAPTPRPEPSTPAQRPRPASLSYQERLGTSDLPPGVVARGNQVGAQAAPLSPAARERIISEHAQRQTGGPAPRRRELVRSAIGPTGRQQQQQRGRPGRARKMAPGKKAQKTEITTPSAAKRVIRIEDQVSLQVLAQRMSLKATDVLGKLMQMGMTGVMINSNLDVETAGILASEFGFEVENVAVSDDDLIKDARGSFTDAAEDRTSRPPVVTVMGHVDHGKTSLLDTIRKADVAAGESGGITQHLGAYRVEHKKGTIVFLDTPGHAAFTAMRARGAQSTDVVILVVAADDGVMPQTKEAISHAKSAEVPIVVAVNKCDKEDARPEVVMRDLASEGLQPEEWGGDTMFFNVSAITAAGIDKLLDGVLLQSEMQELSANPEVPAQGVILEAYLDKGRGPVANILVQDGTLSTGDSVVAGGAHGKIRAMTDDRGKPTSKAGPSTPVEVLGLSEVPETGDAFYAVTDTKSAQQIAERRKKPSKAPTAAGGKAGLEQLLAGMKAGDTEELNLVVKADVQGSAEALVKALSELSTDKVKVNIVLSGAGGITENDVMLASASNAIVIGFHVRPTGGATKTAKAEQVEILTYNIIYEAVDAVKDAMLGKVKPEFREVALGRAEVRQVFSIPRGAIAGCFVAEGKIVRSGKARLVRDSVPVWEGEIKSLRRVKDDVREVQNGLECGVGLENFNDIKENDVIECFEVEEISASL
ncbi:MAG: translation initiation factor IF-2 [Myxococcales bacterium]|nr:translation initiation factor IF-2 [Myxococcales bacterium]